MSISMLFTFPNHITTPERRRPVFPAVVASNHLRMVHHTPFACPFIGFYFLFVNDARPETLNPEEKLRMKQT